MTWEWPDPPSVCEPDRHVLVRFSRRCLRDRFRKSFWYGCAYCDFEKLDTVRTTLRSSSNSK